MRTRMPDEEKRQQKQIAIGKNIVQVIGEKAKALFINAPGLGYSVGALAVVLLIVAAYFGIRGIFVRVEQVIPTPTPWPLPTPAAEGEILVLVAQFERLGGVEDRDPSGRTIESLQASLPYDLSDTVRFVEIPRAFSRGQLVEARVLGERLNATLVIWGAYDPAGTTVHFTVIPDKEFALRNVGPRLGPPIDQPREFDLYFSERLPSEAIFFTSFTIGQLYYWNEDYSKALALFNQAIEAGEGYANDKALALAYMHRGLALLFPPIQRWPDAITDFQTAVQKDPSLIPAYNNLGFAQRLAGFYEEAREAHMKAIDLAEQEVREIEIARGHLGLGDVLYYTDAYTDALQHYNSALSAYVRQGDDLGQAIVQLGIVKIYIQLGELETALELANQIKDAVVQIGDKVQEGNTLLKIGDVYYAWDDFSAAEQAYSEALEIFSDIGDRRGQANALVSLGDLNYILDRFDQALSFYRQALTLDQELGERLGQANAMEGIGTIYFMTSQFEDAIEHYSKSLELYQYLGDIRGQGIVYRDLGDVYSALGDYEQAMGYYEKALPLLRRAGDPLSIANLLNGMGDIAMVQGEWDTAEAYYTEAIGLFEQVQNKIGLMNAYQSLGYLQLQQVQAGGESALLDAAIDNLERALEIAREIGDKFGEANSLTYLGSAETLAGNYEAAIANFNLALPVYRELGNRPNEGFTLLSIGIAQAKLERFDEAIRSLSEALTIFDELDNDPGRAEVMNVLAFVYAETGQNLEEAENLALQAVEILSEISPVARGYTLDTLGWVYFKQGRFELAVETLTEAYELFPSPDTKAHLDAALEASGR